MQQQQQPARRPVLSDFFPPKPDAFEVTVNGSTPAKSHPAGKTIVFDLRIVRDRNGFRNKFADGTRFVDTYVDGVHYNDAQVIDGVIVELDDGSFGPTRRSEDEPTPELKPVSAVAPPTAPTDAFHWNASTKTFSWNAAPKRPLLLPKNPEMPWVVAAPLPPRGLASGMGLPKGTRIQKSTLDKVTFEDAIVVADGSIVELAALSEPERNDALMRPVVMDNSSIDPGNVFRNSGRLKVLRRISNTVVIGTGNEIGGSMLWCNIYGSQNLFECSADRLRVKGSKNHFSYCQQVKNSTVTGDGNQFRGGAVFAQVYGSENVFLGSVTNARFDGDRTKFEGKVTTIIN